MRSDGDQNNESVKDLQTVDLLWVGRGSEQMMATSSQGHASHQTETTTSLTEHKQVDQSSNRNESEKDAQNQSDSMRKKRKTNVE